MAFTKGKVYELRLARPLGKLVVRSPPDAGNDPVYHFFIIYNDSGVAIIDPLEMVKRNWLISLLEQAEVHGLDVTIGHKDEDVPYVRVVTLHPAE